MLKTSSKEHMPDMVKIDNFRDRRGEIINCLKYPGSD